jgi:hypothetical protein
MIPPVLARLAVASLVGAALFPLAVFYAGLALGPPLPMPAKATAPPLLAEAIWARANGGPEAALAPITPFSLARLAVCVAVEDFKDTTPGDARRVEACRRYQPALAGLEYFSGLHMRDNGLKPSFREGLGRLSTTVWLTHSWTRAEFLNTLAARGEAGRGFRGAEAAARGYFGVAAADLTLPQAAFIGALIGDRRADPWCDPESAVQMRNRILERMRDNGAISEVDFQAASVAPLDLTPERLASCAAAR